MGKVSKDAAMVGPFPYRREMDDRETQLVSRYAQDIGLIIYAWNGMMSAMFGLYLGAASGGNDPQAAWSKLRADAARLDSVTAAVKGQQVDEALRRDVAWVTKKASELLPYRNAIVHLGLTYLAGSMAPDPYGKTGQAAIVERFLDTPGDLTAVMGDLRVIGQYVDDLAIRLRYSLDDPDRHMRRPTLYFDPERPPPVGVR